MKTTLHLGTWLSVGSPVIAELAALSGFDWVLFDLEHGCSSEHALPDQLRAIRGTSTKGIVRVAAPAPDQIGRVLDWGADGVMVPHVETAGAAGEIVRSACHPPRGRRGLSRTSRAAGYGLGGHRERTLIFAQIESRTGVAAARAIAGVAGIDVLFVGPADLRNDLETGERGGPGYEECLATVANAAREAGKEAGILVRDPAEIDVHLALGFTRIAVDSDLSILRKSYQTLVSAKP